MADAVSARESAVDGSSFTRVTQAYGEDLKANRGAETPVDWLMMMQKGGSRLRMQPQQGLPTKWPPNVKLALARAVAPPLGGHLVEVPVVAA